MKFSIKAAFLLVLFSSITFGNCLFNDFVGDDHFVIRDNSFYDKWQNVGRIFQKSYNTSSEDLFVSSIKDVGSGSVAYRPVLTLTYFFDVWIWGKTPMGFHLTNFLIHIINVLLLYLILLRIKPLATLSFWIALIFGIHPIATEAVNCIGYRADVLSTLFVLLGFLSWQNRKNEGLFDKYNFFSIFFYLCAVLSKESSILFPGVLFCYEWLIQSNRNISLNTTKKYLGHVLIGAVYLYLYFFVFKNDAVSSFHYWGTDPIKTVVAISKIFSLYLKHFFLPHTISFFPGLYYPVLSPYFSVINIICISILIFFSVCFVSAVVRKKWWAFFMVWFVAFYLPVANIIPMVNPIAHRFIYLPIIGFCVLLVLFINFLYVKYLQSKINTQLLGVIRICFLVFLMTLSINLTFSWRNNFMIGKEWVENYPTFYMGYTVLGSQNYSQGRYEKAIEYLRKSVDLGTQNPTAPFRLGYSYLLNDEPKNATFYFRQLMDIHPRYAAAYFGMGEVKYYQKKYDKAIIYFKQAAEIEPYHLKYHFSVIRCYLLLDQYKEALKYFYSIDSDIGEIEHRVLVNFLNKYAERHNLSEKVLDNNA